MYMSHVNPICCALTIMFVIFCIMCVTRILFPHGDDHDIICVGYPNDIILYHSHSNQKKGWYLMYSMNYTLPLNPELCLNYQNIKYKTKKYKLEQEALIIFFFGMMISCSNGRYHIERQRLLT